MTRKWLVVILTLGLIFSIVGCSKQTSAPNTSAAQPAKKVINVGLSNDVTPPFLFTDDKGELTGYDIDYLKELEKKLPEYQFKYESGAEEAQLIATDTGKYDFAMNWFFRTPEREKKFLYPEHEYGYSVTALITKSDRNDIKTFDDMVGKKFPPMSASGGLRSIINSYIAKNPDKPLKIESIDEPSNTENLKAVASGKADAVFLNKVTFDSANAKLKLPLKVGGIISKEPVSLVFNKKQTELAKKIDAATEELKANGTLSKLAEKWFKVDFFKGLDYINQGFQQQK